MKPFFLVAVLMTATLAVTLFAQNPGGLPPFGSGQRPDPATALKNALGLTDAQIQAVNALVQAEQPRIQAIFAEIGQKRQALDALLSASSPVAVDVGNAAISLRTSENKLEAERTSLITQIKQQLTGDQQQKLDALLAARGGRGLPFLGLGGPRLGNGLVPHGRGAHRS